jgi:hypothetical protein
MLAGVITHRLIMTPCPWDVDLRNGSREEGERETQLQNNIKAKPEQLKLNNSDPSTWL